MKSVEISQRFDKLSRKYYCDRQMIKELLTILLQDLPLSLKELEEGYSQNNFTQIRKAAHSVANISGTVLESEIMEMARKVEEASLSRNLQEVVELLNPLKTRVNELCLAASTYLQL